MGPDDRWLEQQEEHGHSLDLTESSRGVCPGCVADDGLRRFVGGCGPIEGCDFCGGPGPQGLSLGAMFDYMGDRIAIEWDRAIDTLYFGEGDDLWESGATVYDASELLWELGEPLGNDELREAFVEAFEDDRISSHAFRLAHHQRLAYGWEAFARYVTHEVRYLFLRTGRGPQGDEELIAPAQLLDEMTGPLELGGLLRRRFPGTPLARARDHRPEEVLATPADLGSPPSELAGANRMSPPGISMFYGSEDVATALAELHLVSPAQLATVGTWSTARAFRFLDLVDVEVPTLFDAWAKHLRPSLLFLRSFATDVSRPPRPGGEAVDYVPTQVFTEYVRHVLGDRDDPVRGIRYSSAARPGGVSWVLFVGADGCTEAAPGWQDDHSRWLGLDSSSLRRFRAAPAWTEIE